MKIFPPQITAKIQTLRNGLRALKKPAAAAAKTINTPQTLAEFLESRASFVAQTALYGYMKTRAGTRFPELFEDAAMLASINIAKWRLWLACFSDLAVYSGVLLRARTNAPAAEVRAVVSAVAQCVLARAGIPADAGADFAAAAGEVCARINAADFDALGDDESAFIMSPRALIYWAPVADELKKYDTEIIRNSVRFRWQEIRRQLRKKLRADAVMGGISGDVGGGGGDVGNLR